MSRVCEKCGNVISDDVSVCPNCGETLSGDGTLQDVLSGLGLGQAEQEDVTESAFFDEELQEELPEPEEPEEAPEQPKKKEKKKEKKASKKKKGKKKEEEPEEDDVFTYDDDGEYDDDDADEGSKKPMKKRSAAIIGVLIGLLVALLLIVGGVAYMLNQMGFFAPMSDEELLGTATISQEPAPVETVDPEAVVVVDEPEISPEAEEPEASPEESPAEEREASEDGEEPEELDVDVELFELTSGDEVTMYSRGETAQIEFNLEPASALPALKWSSDNELIAVVDENGVIQARRGGTCVVTGTVGGETVEINVDCEFEVPLTVLDMNYEDITMSYEGQTVELAIDYDLSEEYVKATVWESTNPEVAKVDKDGVVTAVSDGTAVIQASIAEYTASCIVRCVDVTGNRGYNSQESEYVINYEDVTLTRKGEYFQLELSSVLPTGTVPECTWTSDDTSVATVDSKGVVTAISDGVAYVTTTVGEDKFRCIVRVSIS